MLPNGPSRPQSRTIDSAKCKIQTALTAIGSKFRVSSNIDRSRPILILGESISTNAVHSLSIEDRLKALIYFSYRSNIPSPFANSGYTSDCGWGCLLRSMQMLIGETLLRCLRLRGLTNELPLWHRRIIELFADDADSVNVCPFSINVLLQVANVSFSKRAGDLFGPSLVAQLVDAAFKKFEANPPPPASANEIPGPLDCFSIYVARDATVFWPDLLVQICATRRRWHARCGVAPGSETEPVRCLILIPLRLGRDACLDARYARWLRFALASSSCVGFIGGRRPRHGVYICGYQLVPGTANNSPKKLSSQTTVQGQGNLPKSKDALKFLCLDPHIVQRAVPIRSASAANREQFPIESYHIAANNSGAIDMIRAEKMDASIAVGFLVEFPAAVIDAALPGIVESNSQAAQTVVRETVDSFINSDAVVHFQAEIDRISQSTFDDERRLSQSSVSDQTNLRHPVPSNLNQSNATATTSFGGSSPKRLLPLISFSELHFTQASDFSARASSSSDWQIEDVASPDAAGRASAASVDTVEGDFVML